MRPGDVCEETRRGVTVDTYTYAEKLQEEKDSAATFARSGRWVSLGIGGGLVVVAAVGIVLTRRRRAGQAAVVRQMVQQQAAWPAAQAAPAQHPHTGHYPPAAPPQYQPAPPRHPQAPRQPGFGPHGGRY